MSNDLSPQQRRVRRAVVKSRDTNLWFLFVEARSPMTKRTTATLPLPSVRFMQQRVGAIIAHINKKIAAENLIIRPGKARRTYRLYDLDPA